MTDANFGSWVARPTRYMYGHCDRCGKRRLFFRLYDVYPRRGLHFGLVCADCLIELVSDYQPEGVLG